MILTIAFASLAALSGFLFGRAAWVWGEPSGELNRTRHSLNSVTLRLTETTIALKRAQNTAMALTEQRREAGRKGAAVTNAIRWGQK